MFLYSALSIAIFCQHHLSYFNTPVYALKETGLLMSIFTNASTLWRLKTAFQLFGIVKSGYSNTLPFLNSEAMVLRIEDFTDHLLEKNETSERMDINAAAYACPKKSTNHDEVQKTSKTLMATGTTVGMAPTSEELITEDFAKSMTDRTDSVHVESNKTNKALKTITPHKAIFLVIEVVIDIILATLVTFLVVNFMHTDARWAGLRQVLKKKIGETGFYALTAIVLYLIGPCLFIFQNILFMIPVNMIGNKTNMVKVIMDSIKIGVLTPIIKLRKSFIIFGPIQRNTKMTGFSILALSLSCILCITPSVWVECYYYRKMTILEKHKKHFLIHFFKMLPACISKWTIITLKSLPLLHAYYQ